LIHQVQINQIPGKNIDNVVSTFKSGIKNNPVEIKTDPLWKIIRWFKERVSFKAKKINPAFAWQHRFHDRILRNEKEHFFIRKYNVSGGSLVGQDGLSRVLVVIYDYN